MPFRDMPDSPYKPYEPGDDVGSTPFDPDLAWIGDLAKDKTLVWPDPNKQYGLSPAWRQNNVIFQWGLDHLWYFQLSWPRGQDEQRIATQNAAVYTYAKKWSVWGNGGPRQLDYDDDFLDGEEACGDGEFENMLNPLFDAPLWQKRSGGEYLQYWWTFWRYDIVAILYYKVVAARFNPIVPALTAFGLLGLFALGGSAVLTAHTRRRPHGGRETITA
jgi:hypothetical protein